MPRARQKPAASVAYSAPSVAAPPRRSPTADPVAPPAGPATMMRGSIGLATGGRVMTRALILAVVGAGLAAGIAIAAESAALEIPEPFARFEHMIGSWKGTAVPAANRLKGWSETHRWAWKFAKGKPIGMSLELDGD